MAQGNAANSIAQQKIVKRSITKEFFSKSGAVFSRKMWSVITWCSSGKTEHNCAAVGIPAMGRQQVGTESQRTLPFL